MIGIVLDFEYIESWKDMVLGDFVVVEFILCFFIDLFGEDYVFCFISIRFGYGIWFS